MVALERPSIPFAQQTRRRSGEIVVATGLVSTSVLLAHHLLGSSAAVGTVHLAVDHGALMAAAMLPLAAGSARVVVERALRCRWTASLAAHTAGYALAWFAFAFTTALLVVPAIRSIDRWLAFSALVAAAAAWQVSFRRRTLVGRAGWLRSGPARGWPAVRSEVAGGAGIASRCGQTCWVPMVAMIAAPAPALMAAVLAINLSEFLPGPSPDDRVRRRRPAYAYGVLALGSLLWWQLA